MTLWSKDCPPVVMVQETKDWMNRIGSGAAHENGLSCDRKISRWWLYLSVAFNRQTKWNITRNHQTFVGWAQTLLAGFYEWFPVPAKKSFNTFINLPFNIRQSQNQEIQITCRYWLAEIKNGPGWGGNLRLLYFKRIQIFRAFWEFRFFLFPNQEWQ